MDTGSIPVGDTNKLIHMILIVSSQFDKAGDVISVLEQSAIKTLEAAGMDYKLVQVPGAVEIPLAVQHFHDQAEPGTYKAVITLGCVVKGGTDHYDMVIKSVTDGLTHLALDLGIPVTQGVLACHNLEDARARRELGAEYADTALKMIKILDEA